MAGGQRSRLLPWVGGLSAPPAAPATAGYRSRMLWWMGGLSAPSGAPAATGGYVSLMLRWAGGLSGDTGGVIPPIPPVVGVPTGGGGIDPGDGLRRQRRIVKPTGLVDSKKKQVERRVDESREIHAEVAAQLAKELRDSVDEIEIAELKAIGLMTSAEIDAEIGRLLRKQLRTEEEEILLLMMMAVM